MNKYKNKSNNLTIKNGEVALTYGVKYIDVDEKTKIKPARPYLMIKKMDGIYYSLKLTTQNNRFLDDFKIEVNKYPQNDSIVKNSYVCTNQIYPLEIGDFIKNGIILTKRDLICIYNKIIKEYCIEGLDIPQKLLNFIYQEYRTHKSIVPGCIVTINIFDGQLLILDENENNYICLPIYRDGEREYDEMVRFYKYNNYVDYSQIYYLPKEEYIYLTNYGINPSLFRYIKSCTDKIEKVNKKVLTFNKDLS